MLYNKPVIRSSFVVSWQHTIKELLMIFFMIVNLSK